MHVTQRNQLCGDEDMPRILCVGALTLDTIFQLEQLPPGPGKFIPAQAVEVAAGMASSAAASIARLGGEVSLWASAGQDAVGDRIVAELAAEDCCDEGWAGRAGRNAAGSL